MSFARPTCRLTDVVVCTQRLGLVTMVMRILNFLKLSSDTGQWCEMMIPSCTDGLHNTQQACQAKMFNSPTMCQWHSTSASMSANGIGGNGFCNAVMNGQVVTVQDCKDMTTFGMFVMAVAPQMTGQIRVHPRPTSF